MKSRIFFLICLTSAAFAQPSDQKITVHQYIEKFSETAINEMLNHRIPASITLAQGILESGFGNTPLATYANNHFGIKCHGDWNGPTFTLDDDAPGECFRKYENPFQSYTDHSLFIKGRRWYKPLFELKITDYKAWAKGLKAAGYATEPKYAEQLISLIERYELHKFDKAHSLAKPLPAKVKEEQATVKYPRRSVSLINKRKYVETRPGDSFYKLSKELNLPIQHLYAYNDMDEKYVLKSDEIIFLEPKKKKAQERIHTVKAGETMHKISQHYGVKLNRLYRYNNMQKGAQPKAGEILKLR